MRAPFKDRLLSWRNKATERSLRARRHRQELQRKDEQIARLRAENEKLRQQVQPTPVANHVYPAELIGLVVFMVVAGCSLRATAKTVHFVGRELFGWDIGIPSASTVRNWTNRFGLFVLHQTKDLSGKYVAIVDESIQIGKEKLLLVLGYPTALEAHSIAPLSHDQVEVLGMQVKSSWTAEQVTEMVKDCQERLPNIEIVRVISDQGSSLLKAWKNLKIQHVSDCTHWMMNAVKTIFGEDDRLQQFCAKVGSLRQQLAMTDYAFLLPPTLRKKDRFCRIFMLIDWIANVNIYRELGYQKVNECTAFVRSNRWLRLQLTQVHALLVISSRLLKRSGLSQSVFEAWNQQVQTYLSEQKQVTRQARQFAELMREYFVRHEKLYENGERIMC